MPLAGGRVVLLFCGGTVAGLADKQGCLGIALILLTIDLLFASLYFGILNP